MRSPLLLEDRGAAQGFDRDDVEPSSRDSVHLSNGDAESHATGEGGGALVHVQTFERPSDIASRGEECTDVASHLESRAASAVHSLEPSNLRAVRAPLVLVQRGRVVSSGISAAYASTAQGALTRMR